MEIKFNANEAKVLGLGNKATSVTVPCSSTKDGTGVKPVSGRMWFGKGLKMGFWCKQNDGDTTTSGDAL